WSSSRCDARRPPGPPLLPSTTLFRSVPRSPRGRFRSEPARADTADRERGGARSDAGGGRGGRCAGSPADLGRLSASGRAVFDGRDRKSTRLNSSHVKISYAVFCLKKK